MHWPSNNEWWQLIVGFLLMAIWEVGRECRNYLKTILDEIQDYKRPNLHL
jgi:hypothetical protein